jgi:hypothetical protein
LQRNGFVTLLVAILTLTAMTTVTATPTLAEPPRPMAVDAVESIEHVPLPDVGGPLSVRVRALEALVVIEAPSRSVPALARAARAAPRAVCAGLEERPSELRFHCRSKRIVARLVRRAGGYLLEISETRGLPWDGEDSPTLVAFDPPAVHLGAACPGSTPAGRAECQLARGDRAAARAALEEITDGPARGFAALRLGDLAFASGDVHAAGKHWSRAKGQPWERIAAARLCELSWSCIDSARAESIYATAGLPNPLARDLALRHARALAFLGRPAEGARSLVTGDPATSPCTAAPAMCRGVARAALLAPGSDATDALLLWLEIPERDQGPAAYETEVAVAAIAEREGAPIFAASVLAAAAGHVPAHELRGHLLRTSELYLAGGDRVRAGVVLEFARARAGKKGLVGPRWAAVARGVAAHGAAHSSGSTHARTRTPSHAADASEILAAADRSARAARGIVEGTQP